MTGSTPRLPLRLVTALSACFLVSASIATGSVWTGAVERGSWAIDSSTGVTRWLVVFGQPGDADSLFHVEVLEKTTGDPPWKFRAIAAHLALTDAALRASIVRRLNVAEPYPETFDDAYSEWKRQMGAGRAFVCNTTVTRCLDSLSR